VGTFTLDAFFKGELVPPDQRPRLIVRPNPFSTLRDFLRESAFSMAAHGEGWWWTAARDADNLALSVIPVPVREVRVEGNDWLNPTIKWRGSTKTSDMSQLVLMKEIGARRGHGPLQLCGAAISAAVESQEWAANFYADGGHPPIVLHSEIELEKWEAVALREAWVDTPPNMPQVTSGGVDAKEIGTNEGAAQMLETRNFNAGEAARMFGIPGPLLEFSRGGSSLTYTNIATLMDQLVRQCLLPNYLEPMEQALTDLLPRNWTTRFNVDAILRADIQTRFNVYKTGIESGVLTVETAQQMEGLVPGSVENAPVPYSPPAAIPAGLPNPSFMSREWRCDSCGKKLAEKRGAGTVLTCRCGALAVA
jgi:HK97 family phage portal protein